MGSLCVSCSTVQLAFFSAWLAVLKVPVPWGLNSVVWQQQCCLGSMVYWQVRLTSSCLNDAWQQEYAALSAAVRFDDQVLAHLCVLDQWQYEGIFACVLSGIGSRNAALSAAYSNVESCQHSSACLVGLCSAAQFAFCSLYSTGSTCSVVGRTAAVALCQQLCTSSLAVLL